MIFLLMILTADPCIPSGALFWPVDVVERYCPTPIELPPFPSAVQVQPSNDPDPEAVLVLEAL